MLIKIAMDKLILIIFKRFQLHKLFFIINEVYPNIKLANR